MNKDEYNLEKNKKDISSSEYSTAIRNIINKMKNKNKNDVLEEVKEKVKIQIERVENRVEIEQEKLEVIEDTSKYY